MDKSNISINKKENKGNRFKWFHILLYLHAFYHNLNCWFSNQWPYHLSFPFKVNHLLWIWQISSMYHISSLIQPSSEKIYKAKPKGQQNSSSVVQHTHLESYMWLSIHKIGIFLTYQTSCFSSWGKMKTWAQLALPVPCISLFGFVITAI